jgi:hypothetical protein
MELALFVPKIWDSLYIMPAEFVERCKKEIIAFLSSYQYLTRKEE